GSKLIYFFVFLALPMMLLSQAWWLTLIGFFLLHVVEGLTIAIVFQLAHVVEAADFPEPAEDGTMENTWAIHQVKTTANFARKSFLANWFFGGLNFQVEHHLFPQICHVHYQKISVIVKQTAEDFNLRYNEYQTMWGAFRSHLRMLKKFGREETLSM
ncbi:MAG TPA: fatty acid desaturase, partial [Bacteroidia bacterium]|nr:fatty acid desaturase [Bacteroidia bacterium]